VTTWGWSQLGSPERWLLAAILLAALVLRIVGISDESLWIDEAASWGFSQMPIGELWRTLPDFEAHPPLYYTLLKWWAVAGGTSEAALRSLSAVAGTITVYFVFVIGRFAIADERSAQLGLCAAAIVALHPVQIYFSQEARPYAIQTLGVAMALAALAWWLRNPAGLTVSPARLIGRGAPDGNRAAAMLFVVGAVLALWMHYTAVAVVGLLLGTGAAVIIATSTHRARATINLAILGFAILLLWTPCLLFLLRLFRYLADSGAVRPPDITSLGFSFNFLFGPAVTTWIERATYHYLAAGFGGLLPFAGALLLLRRREWAMAAFLVLGIGLPLVAILAITFLGSPAFAERSLIWMQIPYAVLTAAATLWLTSRSAQSVAQAAIVGWFVVAGSIERAGMHKEPWRQIVETLEAEAGPEDLIITFSNYANVPMQYYRVAERVRAERLHLWTNDGPYPTMSAALSIDDRFDNAEFNRRIDAGLARVRGTVWVVTFSRTNHPVVADTHRKLADARGAPIERFAFLAQGTAWRLPPVHMSEYRPPPAR
jgi:hypothetical protein